MKWPFPVVEAFPVGQVGREVNFFGGPEAGFGLLVHLPDVVVLDGEEHEAVLVLRQEGFFKLGNVHNY
jgi:hypothetical protein